MGASCSSRKAPSAVDHNPCRVDIAARRGQTISSSAKTLIFALAPCALIPKLAVFTQGAIQWFIINELSLSSWYYSSSNRLSEGIAEPTLHAGSMAICANPSSMHSVILSLLDVRSGCITRLVMIDGMLHDRPHNFSLQSASNTCREQVENASSQVALLICLSK